MITDAMKEEFKDAYFVIVSWGNPYRSGSSDYGWSGAYEDKSRARDVGKSIEKRGPKAFIDWCGSSVQVIHGLEKFLKKAEQVKINPNIENLEFKF